MSALFAGPGPRWFSIAAHRPFVDDLAAGLHQALSPHGPEALADAVVLTPTRRGARALAEAFIKVAEGQALLLPQIRALGDLDEGEPPFEPGDLAVDLPPAISPARRRFELARMVVEHQDLLERSLDAPSALELADALAGLLDSAQIEEVRLAGRIDALVEGELARHWQRSARFLGIATELWPARLAELGLMDVAERRIALLRALAEQWDASPPERPLIAAGSTGSAPATADLLRVIAATPQGAVVLPGLDLDLAESAWAQVGEAHPQGTMKRLLERAGVSREAVRPWPALERAADQVRGRTRRRVVNEALRPAEATADWRAVIAELRKEDEAADPVAEGLQGLSVATARNEEDAASVVALLLRETLETPGKTAALVTPDQDLARRVSARLSRWGVRADSSADAPLAGFPLGVLLALTAHAVADPLDPARTLSILKHGLTRLGRPAEALSRSRRPLERFAFRGPRRTSWGKVESALAGERARLQGKAEPPLARIAEMEAAAALAEQLRGVLDIAAAPFASGFAALPDATRALTEAVEALAADEAGRTGELWAGPEGEAAAGLLSSLMEDGEALPPLDALAFAELIDGLLAAETVRSAGATHARVRILGAIEARLVRADRLILAGLEEGVWPRPPPSDPFLSRPMRAALGLPPPERRLGLSAHDFAQAACAPDVTLITCERRGGQPAVPSRWLWRLRTLAAGAKADLPEAKAALDWARALDAPLTPPPAELRPARRPCPTPPLSARPTALAVTRVEAWVRDPYALYARDILGLYPLPRPDEPVEARLRGTAIHAAFEAFARAHPEVLPAHAEAIFRDLLVRALAEAGMPEPALAREHARAETLAPWVVAFERARRNGAVLHIEQKGEIPIPVDGEPFTISARADRLELRRGAVHVLDFKTGVPPSEKVVRAGFSPQLTLTAAIVHRGGFGALGPATPGELAYVRVSGGRMVGEVKVVGPSGESLDLAEAAVEGLTRRVRAFRREERGYLAKAAPQFMNLSGDYDHLARVVEWHVMGEAGEEAAA